MNVVFYKYHGTGNDFIMIDARSLKDDLLNSTQIEALCSRRFGIGADGMILLRNHQSLDFMMDYYNADGKRSTMCGNGGRCLVEFARFLGVIKNTCTFMAIDGPHEAMVKNNAVSLKMKEVHSWEQEENYLTLDTGSPHYVTFVEDVSSLNVYQLGKEIRNSDAFIKEGINVNFVSANNDAIEVATYERGVEDETFSCGTGVVAAAISTYVVGKEKYNSYNIKTKGGDLRVSFDVDENKITNIWLHGPARQVFKGELNI